MSDQDNIIKITDEDMDAAARAGIVILDDSGSAPPGKQGKEAAQGPEAKWDLIQPSGASKEPVDIILAIDTSGSMSASDYEPDRLTAAKQAATIFARRKVVQGYNDRVGIIGFGGSPTVVHQLDPNLDKVAGSIHQLSISHTGTMIGTALQAAAQELTRFSSKRRAIVLLSDGGDDYDSSNPVKVASSLGGIKVFTIGMGTVKGGMATLPHGKQLVRLNEALLQQIAKATGGDYLYAPDVAQLQRIYAKLADY